MGRERDLFVGARVKRVDVVIGMAHRVFFEIPPGEDAKDPKEEGV